MPTQRLKSSSAADGGAQWWWLPVAPGKPAFEVTDAAFAAGSPFDDASEGVSMLFGAPLFGRFALAGDHHVFHAEVGELVVDLGFALAAVGGDRAGCLSGPLRHTRHGRG